VSAIFQNAIARHAAHIRAAATGAPNRTFQLFLFANLLLEHKKQCRADFPVPGRRPRRRSIAMPVALQT